MSGESLRQAWAVGIETRCPAGEEVERRVRRVLRAEEALEHPVSRDGVDQSGGVADDERASACERGPSGTEREPVPADLLEVGGSDPVSLAEVAQVLPERRAFPSPAPDAEIDVIAFGKDPAVASGDDSELEHQLASVVGTEPGGRKIALQRHAHVLVSAQPERAGRDSVHAVGSDEQLRLVALLGRENRDASLPALHAGDAHPVPELRAHRRGPLGEKEVEPLALREVDEGNTVASPQCPAVPEAKIDRPGHVFDDGIDGEREQPGGPFRHAATAGLVPREGRPVEEEDICARGRKPVRGRRPRGPGTDHDRVVASHASILSLRMRARPWVFSSFVVAFFLAVFRIDVAVGLHGQLILGAATWLVFLAALKPLTPEGRMRALLVVAAATCMEVLGSIVWGVYTYRLGNLPLFVPPGHGLVYLTGLSLTQTSLVSRHQRAFLAAVGAVAVAWAVAGLTVLPRTDASGALGMAVFLVFLFRGRVQALYGAVFLVVAVLEISGTAVGVWAWKDVVPGLQLPSGNPPSGAASGYVLFDIVAIALTARLMPLLRGRWPLPASSRA
jgi:hypothetical protein